MLPLPSQPLAPPRASPFAFAAPCHHFLSWSRQPVSYLRTRGLFLFVVTTCPPLLYANKLCTITLLCFRSVPTRTRSGNALREDARAGQASKTGWPERRRKASRRRLPVGSDSPQDSAQVHPHGHPRGIYNLVSIVFTFFPIVAFLK